MHDVDHVEPVFQQPFLDLHRKEEFVLDDKHAACGTHGVAGPSLRSIHLRFLRIHVVARPLRDVPVCSCAGETATGRNFVQRPRLPGVPMAGIR